MLDFGGVQKVSQVLRQLCRLCGMRSLQLWSVPLNAVCIRSSTDTFVSDKSHDRAQAVSDVDGVGGLERTDLVVSANH
jgi:hypothetical protein